MWGNSSRSPLKSPFSLLPSLFGNVRRQMFNEHCENMGLKTFVIECFASF